MLLQRQLHELHRRLTAIEENNPAFDFKAEFEFVRHFYPFLQAENRLGHDPLSDVALIKKKLKDKVLIALARLCVVATEQAKDSQKYNRILVLHNKSVDDISKLVWSNELLCVVVLVVEDLRQDVNDKLFARLEDVGIEVFSDFLAGHRIATHHFEQQFEDLMTILVAHDHLLYYEADEFKLLQHHLSFPAIIVQIP